MFDGKDRFLGSIEFISSCYPHFLGVWVLVCWHYYCVAEVTKKAFVMIDLLPLCVCPYLLVTWSDRGCQQARTTEWIAAVHLGQRILSFLLPSRVAFLVLVYFGLYVIVHLFGQVHLLGTG